MPGALFYGLIAMVAWGVWVVLAGLAAENMLPTTAMILSYAASVVVALAYLFSREASLTVPPRAAGLALLAGVFAGIGAVSFYTGLARGSTAVVTTVSAMYFVVAAILSVVFLGESIALTKVAGIVLAVVAVALLSL